MTSALDMSLGDIIKSQKASRPRAQKARTTANATATAPSRTAAATRNARKARKARSGRDKSKKPYQAGIQQYKATPVAPLRTSVIRQSVPDGSKMQVSNLDHRVTAEDLKLVFSSRVGPLKKCTLMYDQHGKSTGTALVHFTRVTDAELAMQKFNGVPLDGRDMKIELIVAAAAVQAAAPPAKAQSKAPSKQAQQKKRAVSGVGRGRGRGRGRGGRQGEKKENKTADQLDAEMTDYMQVEA
ncbi:hypothetical protein BGZ80_010218 [Entomortierella chlamydospora]|uniref:RRM domain-containing protein n=1 Tax=Entomortierella chlamydospora TaxID=101097 RepID=A0A9P6N351_9FUNG|nr:hypothetical protein BGZ79_000722 [Entomortierella chlamydospora]KAG0023158.1 hypothetical protein BGZ80_010218 [Entomortierella chlamydospora]